MPSSRELCQAALLLSDALWLLMEQRKSKLQVALPCLVCRAFTTVHGLGPHTCNPSTQETGAEGLWVQRYTGLHSIFVTLYFCEQTP